jgi:hypothetical protein
LDAFTSASNFVVRKFDAPTILIFVLLAIHNPIIPSTMRKMTVPLEDYTEQTEYRLCRFTDSEHFKNTCLMRDSTAAGIPSVDSCQLQLGFQGIPQTLFIIYFIFRALMRGLK